MITKIVQTQEEPGCQTIWAPFAQGVIHCRGLAGVFRVRTYRFCSKKRGLRYVFTSSRHSAGGLRGVFGSERIVFARKNGVYDTFSLRGGSLPGPCGGFSGQNVSFLLKKTGFTIRFHFESALCRGLRGVFGSERIVFAQKNGVYDTFSLRGGSLPGPCGGFSGQNVSFLLEKTGFTIRFHSSADPEGRRYH